MPQLIHHYCYKMVEIKRYNHFSKLNGSKACRALAVCAALALLGACADDDIPGYGCRPGDSMDFDIALTESWQEAAPEGSPRQKVSISRMSGDSDELYLITTATPQPDSAATTGATQSRGTAVTTATFYDSFGLSALCYTGTWPDEAHTYCDNLRMKKTGTAWAPDETGKKLGWVGSGRIRFFAYAPHSSAASAGVSAPTAGTDGIPEIKFTAKSTVTAQTDLLAAVTDTRGDAGGTVALTFGHTLTAVSVKTGDAMLAGTFKSVKLSGVYGSGTLRADLGSDSKTTYSWTPSGSATSFTAELGADGTVIAPDTGTYGDNHYTKPGQSIADGSLTFFMVPQTLPSGAKLEIVFTDELTKVERTLTADLSGKKWLPGERVEYAVSSTGIKATPVFSIELANETTLPYTGIVDVKSMQAYMKVAQYGKDDVNLPLKLRFESSVDTKAACTFTPTGEPSTDVTAKKTGVLRLVPQAPYKDEMRKPFDDLGLSTIYTTEADGTAMDLSQFNGLEKDGRTESANTYVIRTPGLYKLPLVYGNSLNNTKAYIPGTTADKHVWEVMVDHRNNPIAHEWIKDQHPGIKFEAELLWQDSPGLLRNLKLSEDRRWLQFEIREATLNQGNAHIAIKDPATGHALWSWQIYVTHYDWSGDADVDITAYESNLKHAIAPANVGYCTMHSGAPERTQKITVYATGADGKETALKTFTFTQEGIAASSAGDNTYYQWGRKDPVPGGIYSSSTPDNLLIGMDDEQEEFNMITKPVWTPDGNYGVAAGQSLKAEDSGTLVDYYESIARPDVFFMHNYIKPASESQNGPNYIARRIWTGLPYNIWDGLRNHKAESNSVTAENDNVVQKTVYDPSPRGYNVPHVGAYTGLISPDKYKDSGSYQFKMWDSGKDVMGTNIPNAVRITNDGFTVGWRFTVGGKTLEFYATGLRDLGCTFDLSHLPEGWTEQSWPAFRALTFIYTASGYELDSERTQAIIFALDERHTALAGIGMHTATSSNGAYGMAVRPERSK